MNINYPTRTINFIKSLLVLTGNSYKYQNARSDGRTDRGRAGGWVGIYWNKWMGYFNVLHNTNFASTTQPVHTKQQCSNRGAWSSQATVPFIKHINKLYKFQVFHINERRRAPKPDTKTPKNQQVEKTRGTCTPDQSSGATLGVLGYVKI